MSSDISDTEQPYWLPDSECEECTDCGNVFGLLTRRHHCRLCGYIYCNACSAVRITNVNGLHDSEMHRICTECADELVEEELAITLPVEVALGRGLLCGVQGPSRVLAVIDHTILHDVVLRRPGESSNRASGMTSSMCSADTESSVLRTCPVCSESLGSMERAKAQLHVSKCLDLRRSTVVGRTYTCTGVVLSAEVEDKECGICYEPLQSGQECATLNCLCMFHRPCLDKWFGHKRTCPFHPD